MTQDQLHQSQQATTRQGNLGEQFALSFERKRLREFLHSSIRHFEEHEIALGYDILSFETRTSILPDRYIEVKTFRGHPHFYWTDNEIAPLLQRSEKAIVRRMGILRSINTIPFALYIHYYDTDPAFALYRKTKSSD